MSEQGKWNPVYLFPSFLFYLYGSFVTNMQIRAGRNNLSEENYKERQTWQSWLNNAHDSAKKGRTLTWSVCCYSSFPLQKSSYPQRYMTPQGNSTHLGMLVWWLLMKKNHFWTLRLIMWNRSMQWPKTLSKILDLDSFWSSDENGWFAARDWLYPTVRAG